MASFSSQSTSAKTDLHPGEPARETPPEPAGPSQPAFLDSAQITASSGSNLALSFACLPPEKRRAISIFYAYCRVIDDIADSTTLPLAEKQAQLREWHEEIRRAYVAAPKTSLGAELAEIIRTYLIPPAPLQEILRGVEMDLTIERYPDFRTLAQYCYRVASAVGLVSIEIFTYKHARARDYAVALGMAFQLTNILRDVKKDASFGRIYLPQDEMKCHGITDDDIFAGRWSPRMQQLLRFQYLRARHYFAKSWRLLPPGDRPNMLAAEIMREVYAGVLAKIERIQFNVFEQEARLSKFQKIWYFWQARRRERKADPAPPPPKRVLVLGAGFAGLAAAFELTLRGHCVTVLESRRLLGGRAHSFTDPKSGEVVDNGQHALMGCYHETLDLLRALGIESRLLKADRLDIRYRSARGSHALRAPRLPAPFHLLAAMAGFGELGWQDRIAAISLCTRIKFGHRPEAEETVSAWLARTGQTGNIVRAVWEPLCLATLNESPHRAAASLLANVIDRALLASADDSKLLLSRVGLSDLLAPEIERILALCGSEIRRGSVVARLEFEDGRVAAVHTADGVRHTGDHVVSALPWNALRALLPPESGLAQACHQFEDSPIVSIHLWFDHEILGERDGPFLGLLDSPLHWIFSHDRIAATPARRSPPAWRYSLVMSGATDLAGQTSEELEALALKELRRFLPAARDASVTHRVIYRSRSATFASTPAAERVRPNVRTAWTNFWLAGDWTHTGLPATIEGAIASGRRAGKAVDEAAVIGDGSS
jgi:squalene synthase HpnD